MSREEEILARARAVYAERAPAGRDASKLASNADLAPPPAAAVRVGREQLSTRVRHDLRDRLDAFVDRHDSTVQGVIEAALDEYMTRRGG